MTMRRRARWIASTAAVILIVVGLAVALGWLVHRPELSEVIHGTNSMAFNTAICFLMAGVAVLALGFGRANIAAPLAFAVLLIALATLVEFLFSLDLGVDQWLLREPPSGNRAAPGRMAPNTAAAFVLAGLAILALSYSRHIARTSIASLFGVLTLTIGVTALIGYAFELRSAYEWGWATQMAALSAFSFAVLGIGLLAESVDRSGSRAVTELPWLATSVGIAASMGTIIVWHALDQAWPTPAPDQALFALPHLILMLGLATSALLAGVIAQAGDLHRKAVELQAANQLISTASDKIRDLYDHAPCGYHSLDAEGAILDINETELDWLGYSREEVIGRKRIIDLFTLASSTVFRERFPRFKETGEVRDVEVELKRKDGTILPALINATGVYDADGRFLRSRSTVFDMTERKRQELERERAAEQLRRLGETIEDLYNHAPCGYHSLDAEGRITRINDTELSWLGYSRSELVGRKTFSDLLAAESRQRFEACRKDLARQCNVTDADYDLVRRDGALMAVSVSMLSVLDTEGRLVECRATVHDVAERRRLEQLLRDNERRLHHLLDTLPAAVVVHAPDTTIRYANSAAERLLGLSRHRMLGMDAKDPNWQFLRDDGSPMPEAEYPVSHVRQTRVPLQDFLLGIRTSLHAEPRWLLVNAVPDLSAQGELLQIVVSCIDVSERRKLERELEYRTRTDLLTGLATRRHFLELAEHEMSRLRRHDGSMSLLAIDVDHFKSINDTYGHHAGDAVLTALGQVMLRTLRRIDVAGRFGGEEFVVLLPSTDLARALEVAERLRQAIASTETAVDAQAKLKVTVSIGVAAYEPEDQDLAMLIRRADEAMYVCKRSGRNCVSSSTRADGGAARQAT